MKKIFLIFFMIFTSQSGAAVTFTRVTIDSSLYAPHGVCAGDIMGDNQDWMNDAFISSITGSRVSYYLNDSSGFKWENSNIIYFSDRYCMDISSADLDGDGKIDAVSSNVKTDSTAHSFLAVHRNNGDGTFVTVILDTVKTKLRETRLKDMNGDGRIDIIVAGCAPRPQWIQESGIYWYQNNSTPGNMNFTRHFIETCNGWKVDCFDDEPDWHLEIVTAEEFFGANGSLPARLLLYKNNGAEGFTRIVIDPDLGLNLNDPPGGGGVRCAYIDGDDKTDIVAASSYYGDLYWYRNNGGNSFTKNVIDTGAKLIDGIDVGDFEPDGDIDIVACGRDCWVKWYENDGNGNFIIHNIDSQYKLFDFPTVTYLDGDTCPDILITDAGSPNGHMFAYLNTCGPAVEENAKLKTENLKLNISGNKILLSLPLTVDRLRIAVFDLCGREKEIICNGTLKKGNYTFMPKIKTSGVYFVKLEEGNYETTKKLVFIK